MLSEWPQRQQKDSHETKESALEYIPAILTNQVAGGDKAGDPGSLAGRRTAMQD